MANRDLTPWAGGRSPSPFGRDPFADFRRQMDRLFDDFFVPMEPRSFAQPAAQGGRMAMWPSLDLHETEQAYEVTAELPGLEQKDVDINLREDALVISGEKRQERTEEDKGRHYTERSFGRFERVIPLPTEVDPERVEATFNNGLLKITLPKNPRARETSRRIEIRPQGDGGPSGGRARDAGARSGGRSGAGPGEGGGPA
jgi:HSP20 family protein